MLTQYLIQNGLSSETLVLIFMLPILVTLITFSRQVIGLKGLGIYTPLIITFSFLLCGLKLGLIAFLFIFIVGLASRWIIKHFRLLYLPRMSLVLISISVFLLLAWLIAGYFNQTNLLKLPQKVSIFGILILIALMEKFIALQIERSSREAIILTTETVVLAIVSYFIVNWPLLQNIVFNYPFWIISICLIANIFLGKWTGLRLSEYFRFREVIKQIELPKK